MSADRSAEALADLIRIDDRSRTSPVILHVPHASRLIPARFMDSFVVGADEVTRELDALTDAATDRIADGAPTASRVQHGLSRLLVDVERFPGDEEEMNAVGMGVLYTHGSHRQELRRPSEADRSALMAYFSAYSTAVADLVERTLDRHGRAVILDVHSYPRRPSPYELHGDERRPELCVGVDPFHTPADLVAAVREAFDGLELLENEPFHGAYVPLRFYERDERVQSVMLEIRRDVYLRDGEPVPDAVASLGAMLCRLVGRLIDGG
jgi:N-formylglutamate amidohydrolase